MQTARRLYLYVVSGVTLGVVAIGLALLLDALLTSTGVLAHTYDSGNGSRERVSQAIAMLGVAVPVWAFHWAFVQRSLGPGRPGRDAERGSPIRAFYLTLILLISILFWVSGTVGFVSWLLASATRTSTDYNVGDPVTFVTSAAVGFAVWLYHGIVRRADLRARPVDGAAAWLPRLYLYGISLGGLYAGLTSFATAVRYATGANGDYLNDPYARVATLQAFVAALAWSLVWVGHWRYALQLGTGSDWRGDEERVSRTRIGAFVLTILVAAGVAISAAAAIVEAGLGRFFHDPDAFQGPVLPQLAVGLATAIPWALAWWAHTRWLRREPASANPLRALHVSRLETYGVAAVALAIAATGLGWLAGLLIDAVLGGTRISSSLGNSWTAELVRWLPLTSVAGVVWMSRWSAVVGRRRDDPDGEANSTIRRAFLFLTLAVGLIVALGSATVILYRLVGSLVGASLGDDSVSELSMPVGALLAALVVLGYHVVLLRRDQARRPVAVVEVPPTAPLVEPLPALAVEPSPVRAVVKPSPVRAGESAAVAGESAAVASAGVRRKLDLVGPAGADLDAALAAARASLPAGIELIAREVAPEPA